MATELLGGTVDIEGVSVTVFGDYPSNLVKGQRYVLIVDRYPSGYAFVGGEGGIYQIGSNESLQGWGRIDTHLQSEVLSYGSLAGLRTALKSAAVNLGNQRRDNVHASCRRVCA